MNMIERLIARLHRVFNKQAGWTHAIHLTSGDPNATIEISDGVARIVTSAGSYQIDLETNTLAQVAATINSNGNISATLTNAALANRIGWSLQELPKQSIADLQLFYPSSLFYQEMLVYARALQEQADRLQDIERQMYMHTADGDWLNFWGRDMFGIPRFNNETDAGYQRRIVHEILGATQNNVALSLIIKNAYGVDANILDAEPHIDELPPEQQGNAVGRFLLDMTINNNLTPEEAQELIDRVKATVRKFKAAGTDFIQSALRKWEQYEESIAVSETFEISIEAAIEDMLGPGPIFVGSGWRVATPGLLVGNNDAIKEQVIVQQLLASDQSVVSEQIYGG